jgi:serine/threonine protein kinase/tetratricopeptide (TPR) repeat protein
LDLRAYELRSRNIPLKLKPLSMKLLLLLVERRGELVTREQIVEHLWGTGVYLDTNNSINGAVNKIRQALRDDAEQPRFVQTVTGLGYRFIAPVTEIAPPPPPVAQTATAESLIGRKVSHYRILQLLGGGGMGVVYKAEDLKLGRHVAVKFLPGELASDAVAFERLQREARAASALDHPNICSIYHLGEHEGQPFIVMQLLEGQTLREWIDATGVRRTASPVQELVEIAIQIADGLHAAHKKGIIHSDIKPANIFITSGGQSKILDFGVAKFIDIDALPPGESRAECAVGESGIVRTRDSRLTQTGTSVGTPSYLAPEQIRREELDARSDLFSFGLVLYEMATGCRAFSGNTTTVIRDAILNLPIMPIRQVSPELPIELEQIICRSLEKDRDSRYQSANEVRADLIRLRREPQQASRPRPRRVVRWAAACAILIGLALLGARVLVVPDYLVHRVESADSLAQLKARPSVAILGFKNLSGRDDKAWISMALSAMLAAELGAGQQLRIIPSEDVARMKLDLPLPAVESYSRDTLKRVRNHSTADMVVLGSYLALGNGAEAKIRIDLQLQDTRGGETIVLVSRDGVENDLAELVSRSSSSLRQKLGVAEVSISEARQVRASVPANLEAARLYAEGLVRLEQFDAMAARELLERALAADPNHALSHAALAEAWYALGYEPKARNEAANAFDLSANLSREERLSIEGRLREFSHDLPAAIEIYRTLRNFFPDDLAYALRLATAQSNAGLGKDSLQTVSLMRSLPPPLNEDARIDLAEASAAEALSDFKRSQRVAIAAGTTAEAQHSHLWMAAAKVREGWASVQLGEMDRALRNYSEARELWIQAGHARGAAAALHGIAIVQRDTGNFLDARKSFQEALIQFRKIGSMRDLASCAHNFGVLLYYQGDLPHAKKYLEEALQVQRETNDERGVASDLDDLGNVLMSMGDLGAAARSKEQALQGFRKLGNKYGEAITLLNTGEVLIAQGQLLTAKKKFDQALELALEIGDKRGRAYCLLDIAIVLAAQDRLPEARTMAEQSLALRQEIKDQATTAESLLELAEIAFEQHDAKEAESLARSAAEVFDKEKTLGTASQSYALLGRALLAQRRTEDAQAATVRALSLSRESGDVLVRFKALFGMQAVQAESGQFEQAKRSLMDVHDEAQRRGYGGFELEARLHLGELELRSGEQASARERLQQLQQDARKRGFLLIARKARAMLSNLSAPR